MSDAGNDLDEYGKRTLKPLRSVPPVDPQVAQELKRRFMLQGENLRQAYAAGQTLASKSYPARRRITLGMLFSKPLAMSLAAVLLAIILLIAGGAFTVNAAQASLPGEALYRLKVWSEDVRLSMTFSTTDKLDLTLNYTNRRVDEISSLLSAGQSIQDQTTVRFQQELDTALQLAAEMDDTHIQSALVQIKRHAESQGITMQELISKLPPQADPAVRNLRERLTQQVELSSIGEMDPKEFRLQVRELARRGRGYSHPAGDKSDATPVVTNGTPMPGEGGQGNGNQKDQPGSQGQGSSGNNQGQSSDDNGHKVNPTHTPKP